jgi:hypothetical protein
MCMDEVSDQSMDFDEPVVSIDMPRGHKEKVICMLTSGCSPALLAR